MGKVVTMTATGASAAFHNAPVRLLQSFEKMKSRFDMLRALSDDSFTGEERPSEPVLKHAYLNNDVFVKEFGGDLIGFAIVAMHGEEPYVMSIAVDKRYRGMGAGTEILRAIQSHYTSCRKNFIALTCKIDNPAQMLYFKNGYRVTHVAKNFYGQEGHGLAMTLELVSPQDAA